jgi:hypothetical protein
VIPPKRGKHEIEHIKMRGNSKCSLSKNKLALAGTGQVPFPFHRTCAAHQFRCPLLPLFSSANDQNMCAHSDHRTLLGGRLVYQGFCRKTSQQHDTIADGLSTDATAHALLRESPSVPQHMHCRCNCRQQTTSAEFRLKHTCHAHFPAQALPVPLPASATNCCCRRTHLDDRPKQSLHARREARA